jgi:hypothetical protein
MKPVLILSALVITAAAASAAQPAMGQAGADRNRKEALQHYRLGQDAMHNERFEIAEREFDARARAVRAGPGIHGDQAVSSRDRRVHEEP